MSSMGIEALAGATTAPQFPGVPSVGQVDSPLGADRTSGPAGPSAAGFGDLLVSSIDHLEGMTDKAANLSVQAATGDLTNIHDYTIAATEAQVATQLTVAVRNKAVEAFNEIMRMSV